MTTPTTMEERFEEKFGGQSELSQAILSALEYRGFYDAGKYLDDDISEKIAPIIISFIQSEINLAVEKREKEIVDMVSEYPKKLIKIMPSGKLPFVIFGGKADEEEKKTIYFQAFKDVINLIIKK